MQHASLLRVTEVVQGKGKILTGVARTKLDITSDCLRDSGSEFVIGFTPKTFRMIGHDHKAAVV